MANLFKDISKLSKCQVTAIVSAISLVLTEGLNEDDQNTLGGIVVSIGDLISSYSSLSQQSDINGETSDKISADQQDNQQETSDIKNKT